METRSRVERLKKRNKKNKKGKGRRIFRNLLIAFITLICIGVIGGAGLFTYYAKDAPEISDSDLQSTVTSKIYDREGTLIKELGSQSSDPMEVGEVPDVLRDAVLSIEDARFYSHKGIDPIRIVGALIANIKNQDVVQGGSTITQQLIKLSVFSTDFKDQTIERKAQEAWLAIQLEQEYSKEEILTLYLNKMFYSNNTYGAKAAAKNFFNKDIEDINLSEAALLAGIPQAPSDYDPYAHPDAAQERRDLVLSVMLERDMITQAEHDEAVAIQVESMLVPISNNEDKKKDLIIDAYLDIVAQEVQDKLNMNIYTDGLEVYTNMNYQAQEHLYDTVNNNSEIPFPNDEVQTASSIIDVNTGELQAVIGGRKQDVAMGYNRATMNNRSAGSTMKPLTAYGPAIEYLNYSTATKVVDEPYKYSDGNELYNYDFQYKGDQTIREALVGSRNIPAVKVLQEAGLDNAYAFLQKLDINILNDNKKELVEANAIGGEVSPVQLSAAYAAISNNGVYNEPTAVKKVVTRIGEVEEFKGESRQAMKDSTAYMLVDMLKGVPGEFAPGAQIDGLNHSGKTGTTNYSKDQLAQLGLDNSVYAAPDGWFVGMSPQYAIATWIGYDNPLEEGNYLTLEDTRIPQFIYKEMMTYMMKDVPKTDWTKPDSVVEVEIEKYTDPVMLPGPNTPGNMRSVELFVKGHEPTQQSLAYGRTLNPPSGFDAEYNKEEKTIHAHWNPLGSGESGQFELSLNGQVIYTGTGTEAKIPASDMGEYVLRLRVVDGNSSSDTLVITLTLSDEESSEESSSEDEETTDQAEIPSEETVPLEEQVPQETVPQPDTPQAPPAQPAPTTENW